MDSTDLAALGGTAINVAGTIAVTGIAAKTIQHSTIGFKHIKMAKAYPSKPYKKSTKYMKSNYNLPNSLNLKMKKII